MLRSREARSRGDCLSDAEQRGASFNFVVLHALEPAQAQVPGLLLSLVVVILLHFQVTDSTEIQLGSLQVLSAAGYVTQDPHQADFFLVPAWLYPIKYASQLCRQMDVHCRFHPTDWKLHGQDSCQTWQARQCKDTATLGCIGQPAVVVILAEPLCKTPVRAFVWTVQAPARHTQRDCR